MPAYYQRIIVMGVTGADPADLNFTGNGTPVSHFSVCVDEHYQDTNTGRRGHLTTWFRCTAWNQLATQAKKVLAPGTRVFIEGRMRCQRKENKDYWGLTVDGFRVLGDKRGRESASSEVQPQGETNGVRG